MRTRSAVLLALISCWPVAGQNYVITTFAGGGLPAGIPATTANLRGAAGVAVDAAGNLFFSSINAVFRWDAGTGLLSLVAGTGIAGFSGDNGLAVNAQLSTPHGIALDSSGNLYIADSLNFRVRKVANGVITTVAGTGISGFTGDNGPAASAQLFYPLAVAVDAAGNLYIADEIGERIRKVGNGVITTVAGNGNPGSGGDGGPATSAQLNSPVGIALDSAGNLYIADSSNNRIREVTNGVITTVAGNGQRGNSGDGGPATGAELNNPFGVAFDSAGNLYIADTGNNTIRRIANGVIATVAGNGVQGFSGDGGPATGAELSSPLGVAVDSAGHLYIADQGNNRIRQVTGGVIATVAGGGSYIGDGGPATGAVLDVPFGVAVDSAGDVYISDVNHYLIRKVTGGVITTVAGNGIYGSLSAYTGPALSAELTNLSGVAADPSGANLYFANGGSLLELTNGLIAPLSLTINIPAGLAVDSAGNLYVADTENSRVLKVTNGVAGIFAPNGTVNYPAGVAVDSAGNVYIADTGNYRVIKLTKGGITTVAGNGQSGFSGDGGPATSAAVDPLSVAVDSSGNLYIGDSSGRVRKVSNGLITTIAGNGTAGFSGDGGPATSAQLGTPNGVAVDSAGNVYLADPANNRIRLLTPLTAGLSVAITHPGSFEAGQQNAAYTVTVSNAASPGATTGTVALTDTPYPGLTLVSMSGAGWTCSVNTCTRADALNPGASYPPITVTVDVAANAPPQVTNLVTVTGGGSPSASATETDNLLTGCSISLTPPSVTLSANGTAPGGLVPQAPVSFAVAANPACGEWTATSSDPEALSILSGAAGFGAGAISFVLLDNLHTADQGYTITVSGAISSEAASAAYQINQLGSPATFEAREVEALYEQILGRDPDAAGFAFWAGLGATALGQMADSFLTSPEAFDSDFAMMAAYQAATGAPPSYAQFAAEVASVHSGAETVPALFDALTGFNYTAASLYQNLLNRPPAAADLPCIEMGLTACFQQIIGYPANATPIGSPNNEFQSTGIYHTSLAADHTNALYVRLLYFTLLGRDPDPGGFSFWLGVAASGGPGLLFQGLAGYPTRLEILGNGAVGEGLTASPEFQSLYAN